MFDWDQHNLLKIRALGVERDEAASQKTASVQIALRLAEKDLAEARRIAAHQGIGYQTLLKMLVHEGLQRQAKRL